jgi:hypothetical protein
MSLPLRGLITRIGIMMKISLHDSELPIKMYGKITVVTVIKSEAVVSKKRLNLQQSTSSQFKTPQTTLYCIL